MFSQRNLLDLERPSVILVDHNERDQAADGIRSTNIIEIIDHHRIDSACHETEGRLKRAHGSFPQSAARLYRDHYHRNVS